MPGRVARTVGPIGLREMNFLLCILPRNCGLRKPAAASAGSKVVDDGAHRSSSATAIAGEGDHPAKQGGGGGACPNATQESPKDSDFKFALFSSTRERSNFIAVIFLHRQRSSDSCAPSTTVRSLRELQWSPSPAIAVAEKSERSERSPD